MKQRKNTQTGVLFAVIALAVCLGCAFAADHLLFVTGDHTKVMGEESPIFTDGQEAFAISGCVIADNEVTVTGSDPQFAVAAPMEEVSEVHILFGESVEEEMIFQLYYALPGGNFSEENSVRVTIEAGSEELWIGLPSAKYSRFRFDFDGDVTLREILSGDLGPVELSYSPYFVRILFFTLEAFLLVCCIRFAFQKKKEEFDSSFAAGSFRIAEKPVRTILLCNAFLAMTVVFFQPLTEGLVRLIGFPFDNVWWVQLLAALGAALVLSCLMLLLPARGGIIAASVSLGLGTAFLAQCLLLNEDNPFAMKVTGLINLDNCVTWVFIAVIIIAAVISLCCSGASFVRIRKALCIAAGVLFLVQAMSFTVLATSREEGYRRFEIQPQEAISGEMGFGELMNISFERGMPFLLRSEQAE